MAEIYHADYKDPANYDSIDIDNYAQCAWEFLRRNADYAANYYDQLGEQAVYEKNRHCLSAYTRSNEPFYAWLYYDPPRAVDQNVFEWMFDAENQGITPQYLSPSQYHGRQWGLDQEIQDPNDDTIPKFLMVRYPRMLRWEETDLFFAGEEEAHHQNTAIMVAGLDLRSDFKSQSTALQTLFNEEKSKRPITSWDAHRNFRKSWIPYLRVVDAYRAGLSVPEMVPTLAPTADNNYPYKGAEKRLQKQLEAALSLVESGYRRIVLPPTI